jgi:microcystin-dependent protein
MWQFFTSLGREKVQEVADTPTGLITSFAGGTAPTGWLLCDASSVSTTTYAALFTVIGYTYGGSGASFNLPDLRGRAPVGLAAASGLGSTGTGTVTGGSSLAAQTLGAWAGAETITLSAAESAVAAHGHTVNATATHSHTITDSGTHTHNETGGLVGYPDLIQTGGTQQSVRNSNSTFPNTFATSSNSIGAASTLSAGNRSGKSGISINSLAASAAAASHPNMQPYIVTNFIIKI